jgi:hypothetical protein
VPNAFPRIAILPIPMDSVKNGAQSKFSLPAEVLARLRDFEFSHSLDPGVPPDDARINVCRARRDAFIIPTHLTGT